MKYLYSLSGCSLKPLCSNHRPIADIDDEGVIHITCLTCNYHMMTSIAGYQQLLLDDGPTEDILKR
jgi:hypothetical protein